jgi:hypothetical protein
MQSPEDVQRRLFLRLMANASNTEWGRKYDYKNIRHPDVFAERVPVRTYEQTKPYIKRMMMGEPDVLWPGRIGWFSKSSGTTDDKSKYIPVSAQNLRDCHLQGGREVMAWYYENNPKAAIFEGKSLIMGGTHSPYPPYPRTQLGDVSAVMLQNMYFPFKHFLTPDMRTAFLNDWEAKIKRMAEICTKEKLTQLGGVPTWTIVLLREVLRHTGKKHILEVWPHLQLYVHGGVSFAPYREQFKEMLPSPDFHYMETYNASEGFFALQNDLGSDDMLLLLDNGVYYELLPTEEWDKAAPKAISLEQAEIDKSYALVISTNAGLWRYVLGDTVKFTSKRPYKIKITGRMKHFINAFGEEVMVENTDAALAAACQQTGAKVKEYTVAPIYMSMEGKGGHEWLIEFEHRPLDLSAFAGLLDKNLQAVNSDYEAKRYKNIALAPLSLRELPKGSFHNWLKSKGKYGGQHKVPRLANHRDYVEQIISFVNETC